jgi:hypothetical protein
LEVGLKVDAEALPSDLVTKIKSGQVNLDDPATTVALLKLKAVVGITAFFDGKGEVRSVGVQCARIENTERLRLRVCGRIKKEAFIMMAVSLRCATLSTIMTSSSKLV